MLGCGRDIRNGGLDRRAEYQTSGSTTSAPVAARGESMGKIGDNRRANKPNECDGYCGLYVSLPFWLIAMFSR